MVNEKYIKSIKTNDKIEAAKFCLELVGITPSFKPHKLHKLSVAVNKNLDDILITIKYRHNAKTIDGCRSTETIRYDFNGNAKEEVLLYDWLCEWWKIEE